MAKTEQLTHDTNTWRDRHPEKVKDVEARTQMAKSQMAKVEQLMHETQSNDQRMQTTELRSQYFKKNLPLGLKPPLVCILFNFIFFSFLILF